MNNEIKVGEYVRSDNGIILKYEYLEKYEDEVRLGQKGKCWSFEDEEELEDFIEQRITKHSPNIIDLIEEGDYVNGYKVMGFDDECFAYDDNADDFVDVKDTFIVLGNEEGSLMIQAKDIKSIVTKEQFKEMEYNV